MKTKRHQNTLHKERKRRSNLFGISLISSLSILLPLSSARRPRRSIILSLKADAIEGINDEHPSGDIVDSVSIALLAGKGDFITDSAVPLVCNECKGVFRLV